MCIYMCIYIYIYIHTCGSMYWLSQVHHLQHPHRRHVQNPHGQGEGASAAELSTADTHTHIGVPLPIYIQTPKWFAHAE